MKITSTALLIFLLAGCTTGDRYDAIASSCESFAVALNAAADLNKAGKLSTETVAKIDAAIPPAVAVCSGPVPNTNDVAVDKVTAAVLAILKDI